MQKQLVSLLIAYLLCSFGAFAQTRTLSFTKSPLNPSFKYAGESFLVEGIIIADKRNATGREMYFATKREEYQDVLITWISVNKEAEVLKVLFVYITKEQSKHLVFGTLTDQDSLNISILDDTFLAESIAEDSIGKSEIQLNELSISKFKSKEAVEKFKKFLEN